MNDLFDIQQKYATMGIGTLTRSALQAATRHGGGQISRTTERGMRTTPENALRYAYANYLPDYTLRGTIMDIRRMDQQDGRVKKIHGRTSRAAVKGGLILKAGSHHKALHQAWKSFEKRLQLDRREKLQSDMRGLLIEGNLPLQWVIDDSMRVAAGVRMPTETLRPVVAPNGRFIDPDQAYEQHDFTHGRVIATYPLWMLSLVRLDPDNYDDMGSMGRPYLDASREIWSRLRMTEEDMVIRRHDRAAQHLYHSMEGMQKEELEQYKADVEQDRREGLNRDYYSNKKGAVAAIEGDANLDQINDVVLLLDAFFSGAPAPKGLFGYTDGLSRDILEDLKRELYDEMDALQDTAAYVYELGFKLDLLLQGANPDNFDFTVQYAERRTETPNQAVDRALKQQALGLPEETYWRTAGEEPSLVREMLEHQKKQRDPYPGEDEEDKPDPTAGPLSRQRVTITPGNGRKGESGTTITNK